MFWSYWLWRPGLFYRFGMVLLDAWREGIPVVTWDLPVFRDIVDSGQTGLLVENGNTRALATAIAYLLSHPDEARRMGRAGRRQVVERYNWERVATGYLSAYEYAVGSD